MSGFIVRDAVSWDAHAVSALLAELGYFASPSEVWSRIAAFPASTYRTFVAEHAGAVCGFIGLSICPIYESAKPIGWIMALCVAERFRGRGVGTALVDRAEQWFREKGAADMRVSSGVDRHEAHRFYRRLGFSKSGFRFKKVVALES